VTVLGGEMNSKTLVNNIFGDIPNNVPSEIFEILFSKSGIKIERIISQGQCSLKEDWYDQTQDEWVILLEGRAELQFEANLAIVVLNPGDYVLIPAHTKHRVHWTDPEIKTIWLAIHIYPIESDHE